MKQTFYADSKTVKPIGRTYYSEKDKTLWMGFSGSGVEFTFLGSYAEIVMERDTNVSETSASRFAIYVNEELVVDEQLTVAQTDSETNQKSYVVYRSDASESVTIKIMKLSECANSLCGVAQLILETENVPVPTIEKKHKIEYIGDSITCGYGVDAEDENQHFTTETEDFSKAYAYLSSCILEADYSAVSLSGYGIISGYTEQDEKKESQVLPPYYNKFGFSWTQFSSEHLSASDISWDFSKFVPEVIVLNLGTNDYSYTKLETEKCQDYAEHYALFLKQIRCHNPKATIICALGIMGDQLFPYVEKAVFDYKNETKDSNIHAFRLPVQLTENGYGADWHPSKKTHSIAAKALADEIKRIMNW